MRSDLAALDAPTLTALANKGLVKRAEKLIAKGQGPVLDEQPDGTVVATFPDGVITTWPPHTALPDTTCSCGAPRACRHRVATALAYEGTTAAPLPTPWDPGAAFDDALLIATFGHAVFRRATHPRGPVEAHVHRGPVPSVRFATTTVRFPVPHALEHAHTDAARASDLMICRAVLAFRQASAQDTDAEVVFVTLGPPPTMALDPDLAAAMRAFVHDGLSGGTAEAGPTALAAIATLQVRAERAGWRWVVLTLADLRDQLEAWAGRSARHDLQRTADALAELHVRLAAAEAATSPLGPSRILGQGIAEETPLRHTVLAGLGARVHTLDSARHVELFFAEARTGDVLALSTPPYGGSTPPVGPALGARRVAGMALHALASGRLTTTGARRAADHRLTLAGSRGPRQHDLHPGVGLDDVPPSIRFPTVHALRARDVDRAPRLLRSRVRAAHLAVLELDRVLAIAWSPTASELVADALDADGALVRLRQRFDLGAPGACHAAELALGRAPRAVAGVVTWSQGTPTLDLTAIFHDDHTTVPAFAAEAPIDAPVVARPPAAPSHTQAIAAARDALAWLAHHGLHHLAPHARAELTRAADQLTRWGLTTTAEALQLATTPDGWCHAWLRLDLADTAHALDPLADRPA